MTAVSPGTVTLGFLADFPEHHPQVTDWLCQAFGNAQSRAFFDSIVVSSLKKTGLPITFIARDGDRLVGTVGLWRSDLLSRQDLTPWLAALYVDEAYRGRSIGQQLQAHVVEVARQAGFAALYLYATFNGYYERHGWGLMGEGVEYPDERVWVYSRSL
ncbi:GNAT family N-acetyltransferase [Chimaeribacter arupi]|uniref:GNAT family N-acetyltransferase n=1 Tax=Chimaeribacter arupi TaxID=2060066 RepID=UPI000C7B5675|nr:GNAT family N-acetyltransferase [Chimaeribacter arupi]PLR35707.1 GNAT family N-acetyltransferase [Chimaeribacter arupi]